MHGPNRASPGGGGAAGNSRAIHFFDAIYCVHLDSRKDRWESVTKHFDELGIAHRVQRFPAIETPLNRHIGRALSHRAEHSRIETLSVEPFLPRRSRLGAVIRKGGWLLILGNTAQPDLHARHRLSRICLRSDSRGGAGYGYRSRVVASQGTRNRPVFQQEPALHEIPDQPRRCGATTHHAGSATELWRRGITLGVRLRLLREVCPRRRLN